MEDSKTAAETSRAEFELLHNNHSLITVGGKKIISLADLGWLCNRFDADPVKVLDDCYSTFAAFHAPSATVPLLSSRETYHSVWSWDFRTERRNRCLYCACLTEYSVRMSRQRFRAAILDVLRLPHEFGEEAVFPLTPSGMVSFISKCRELASPIVLEELRQLEQQREFSALLGEENKSLENRVRLLELELSKLKTGAL